MDAMIYTAMNGARNTLDKNRAALPTILRM